MSKINKVVFYHKGCPDGFGAAWSAWKSLGEESFYIPVSHYSNISIPDLLDNNSEIYFVDFCPKKKDIVELKNKGYRVIILDHHISARNDIIYADEYVFDMDRSGAGIAWDYFNKGKERPLMINCIEDRDLWRWKVQDSKYILFSLDSINKTFKDWNYFADSIEIRPEQINPFGGFQHHKMIGKKIADFQQNLIDIIIRNVEFLLIDGVKVPAVNSPVLMSYIGDELVQKYGIGAIYYKNKKGFRFSLRSDPKLHDCSKIAEKFGGGGHIAASGFGVKSFCFEVLNE